MFPDLKEIKSSLPSIYFGWAYSIIQTPIQAKNKHLMWHTWPRTGYYELLGRHCYVVYPPIIIYGISSARPKQTDPFKTVKLTQHKIITKQKCAHDDYVQVLSITNI